MDTSRIVRRVRLAKRAAITGALTGATWATRRRRTGAAVAALASRRDLFAWWKRPRPIEKTPETRYLGRRLLRDADET